MSAKDSYSDRRWRHVRARYLHEHPTCEGEHAGPSPLATDVHHLDGQGLRGPRAYDPTNLQALCHSCHSKHTAREQPGGWNRAQRTPRNRPARQHPGLIA